MFAAEPKLMSMILFSSVQLVKNFDTSNQYWRNWLFVLATCCPQKEMLVKVSRPLNSSHVLLALEERPEMGADMYVQFCQTIKRRA